MKIEKNDTFDFRIDNDLKNDFMIKCIDIPKRFSIFKIRYSYKTKRGNWKENYKYLFADDCPDSKFKFLEYIADFNRKKPYRAISNVKILGVTYMGDVVR